MSHERLPALAEQTERILSPGPAGREALADTVRRRVFDTICACRAGLSTDDGRALAATVDALGDRPFALQNRLTVLVGACRATEMDDIHPGACVTAGAIVVPAALALAARLGADDDTLLAAIVGGYETAVHVARAVGGPAAIAHGVWPTYLCAPVAVAAVAARIRRCDFPTALAALTLAAGRSRGSLPPDEPGLPARWLAVGLAAAEGLIAAAAAVSGIRPGALATAEGLDPALRDADLGGSTVGAMAEVETKPFATSRQGLAPLQALIEILDDHPGLGSPRDVTLGVPPAFEAMLTEPARDRWSSLVSLRGQAALAIADRDRLWDPRRAGGWESAQTRALIDRIAVDADPCLTAPLPDRWPGRATVTWPGGRTDQALVTDPHGSAAEPATWDQLAVKWERTFSVLDTDPCWVQSVMELARQIGSPRSTSAAPLLATLEPPVDHDRKRPVMTTTSDKTTEGVR